ncbi:LLM class flavin-dependent oxidoreductase [Actinoplanes teichomyceticus]|uniref:Alkanesulfonate monooxygenase SsuD/methylene tetrahydromethanopterin reductase-like flavin-dependent oxidoreductase (Luciferase family) n=1 Tax=Actinoplanes teichomyceticus TaxID=1867 RepID=A0A561VKR2_ACTTI|nr:LLM class flavin-dependent oxidoreductase [Actinoplanes teichomyceticus]TWG12222.1 alkanesulfonate monooxygenase SsuD/methylene tetrahydromethanopterin reductase-like flavin-dependent oxidoreductase (luciferase family) [Actinoplanes teichomyceticus]GIF14157.1 oxidoreductase [Actinoplanes teichomyceticus]
MTTLGAVLLPQLPPERMRDVAQAADEAGLPELWLWEDCFLTSGVAAASAALAWTRQVRVGVGLLPAPLRNVALTAMEVATLHRLFPGRVHIGVGHGVQDWMAQVGARAESPMTLLREYVTALRALLAGERVTVHGRYVRLDRVALDWPPAAPAPVHVGAVGPRTLHLAGEVADGAILTGGTTPAQVSAARDRVLRGREAAGRADPPRITVYLHAATGPDAAARMAAEQARWGYPGGDDDRTVTGDAAEIAAQVRRWARAGADSVVLQPTPDDPDPEGFVRFVAQDVRALLD